MPKLTVPKKNIADTVNKWYPLCTLPLNVNHVKSFVSDCMKELKLVFHPDNDFANYLNSNGNFYFNSHQAKIMNTINDKCFEVCKFLNLDYYDLCMNVYKAIDNGDTIK